MPEKLKSAAPRRLCKATPIDEESLDDAPNKVLHDHRKSGAANKYAPRTSSLYHINLRFVRLRKCQCTSHSTAGRVSLPQDPEVATVGFGRAHQEDTERLPKNSSYQKNTPHGIHQ